MASLDSVRLKIRHTESHLEILKSEIKRYFDTGPCEVVPDANSSKDRPTFSLQLKTPISAKLGLIVGDCLQNLRSSLDYLVWELVLASKNEPTKQNMFPICVTSDSFQAALRGHRIEGVSSEAAALIDAFQPYHEGEPNAHSLAILDELANINKHRRVLLTEISSISTGEMISLWKDWVSSGGMIPSKLVHNVNFGKALTAEQVDMPGNLIPFIAFNEGAVKGMEVGMCMEAFMNYVSEALACFERFFMPDPLVTLAEIRAAAARIANIAVRTPLVRAQFPGLSGHGTNKEIYLKAESLQPIGAFKIRGAANKILQLTPEEIARGVITYSSGNHAQGVAYAAREVGAKAVIVMPSNAPAIKRAATLALGAQIVDVGLASSERLAVAEQLVREYGYVVIPPYDDEQIIAGQATCGLEIVESLPEVDLVLAPVSGGGLLSGVAAAVKQIRPQARVFGVEPELAGDTAESFRTGRIVTWPAELTSRTIADGLRTQSVGQRNFAHIQAFVEGIITVTEAEIRAAMRAIVAATRLVPEPSGAVAAAALLFHAAQLPPYSTAVAVVSGGNIDPALLAQILTET